MLPEAGSAVIFIHSVRDTVDPAAIVPARPGTPVWVSKFAMMRATLPELFFRLIV